MYPVKNVSVFQVSRHPCGGFGKNPISSPVKTDFDGYVTIIRPWTLWLRNPPNSRKNFVTSSSPIVRMVTFWVLIYHWTPTSDWHFWGDVDSACLNADLKIKQYVRIIHEFGVKGRMSVLTETFKSYFRPGLNRTKKFYAWWRLKNFQAMKSNCACMSIAKLELWSISCYTSMTWC